MQWNITQPLKGSPTQATTGRKCDDTVFNEISQTQKEKYCVTPLVRSQV